MPPMVWNFSGNQAVIGGPGTTGILGDVMGMNRAKLGIMYKYLNRLNLLEAVVGLNRNAKDQNSYHLAKNTLEWYF